MVKLHPAPSRRSSFTLVEMLVSITVLSLLLLLIFSIAAATLAVSDSTGRKADTSNEAKQVLDRIALDIAGMINRPDVDQFYYKGTGNDKMFFYSQQSGFFDPTVGTVGQSPVTLVGYRVNTNTSLNPAAPVLERLSQGMIWDASADKTISGKMDPTPTTGPMAFLTFPTRTSVTGTLTPDVASTIPGQWSATVGTSGLNYDDGKSPYYDAIGNQVFRLEICFQLQNGSFSTFPGYTNSAPVYPASLSNTVAVVVAIATLDTKSRKLVPATSWSTLIAALKDPTATDLTQNPVQLMDYTWNNAIQQPGFASTAGIPAVTASHIRVYQRYYYLNPPKVQ
jgi:hypothetical protein